MVFRLLVPLSPLQYPFARTAEGTAVANAAADELITLTKRLLTSIAEADWATYQELCDPALTAFEPEALASCVEGLEFHRFYFQRRPAPGQVNVTVCDPKVHVTGDAAVIAYVRLVQRSGPDGAAATTGYQETRVWHKKNGAWKHVHFHRSPVPAPTA
jgi:ketosteroid isomerase-like protein